MHKNTNMKIVENHPGVIEQNKPLEAGCRSSTDVLQYCERRQIWNFTRVSYQWDLLETYMHVVLRWTRIVYLARIEILPNIHFRRLRQGFQSACGKLPNLVDFENCQQRGQVKTRFYNLNDLKTQLIEYKFTISKNDLN